MIQNTRTAFSSSSQRTLKLMRTIVTRRNQGTSTMGAIAQKGPYGDHHANAHSSTNRDLSTAVEFGGRINVNVNSFALNQIMNASHNFAQVQDMHVFGKELTIQEAAAAAKSRKSKDVFDKIVILVPHGEASSVTEDEARSTYGYKVEGDIALSQKGIGQALKVSGKTGEYCNTITKLVPELFLVPPLRCATEAALLAFPYYCPGSIYGTKWISHGACHDSGITSSVENLERSFPNIDYGLTNSNSGNGNGNASRSDTHLEFLSWLNGREEHIVAIASTPSWIRDFCDSIEPGHVDSDLRTVGIKFTHM